MAHYEWNGHDIDVELRPFGVTAWLAMGFVVKVQGQEFFPKPDGLALGTHTDFVITDGLSTTSGVVRSLGPMIFLPRMRYVVMVGDAVVATDRQFVKRPYLTCGVWVVLTLMTVLALFGAMFLFLVCRRLLAT